MSDKDMRWFKIGVWFASCLYLALAMNQLYRGAMCDAAVCGVMCIVLAWVGYKLEVTL